MSDIFKNRSRSPGFIIGVLFVLLIVAVLLLILKGVFAWTNPTQAPPGGSGTGLPVDLTTASAELTSDIAMPTGGTYYDGPSVSLGAGEWLINAAIAVNTGVTGGEHGGYTQVELLGGSTVVASDRRNHNQNPSEPDHLDYYSFSLFVTPSGTTTYKLRARTQLANGLIEADANGTGKGIVYIRAVKVGQ